jgi:hypothetical protein
MRVGGVMLDSTWRHPGRTAQRDGRCQRPGPCHDPGLGTRGPAVSIAGNLRTLHEAKNSQRPVGVQPFQRSSRSEVYRPDTRAFTPRPPPPPAQPPTTSGDQGRARGAMGCLDVRWFCVRRRHGDAGSEDLR